MGTSEAVWAQSPSGGDVEFGTAATRPTADLATTALMQLDPTTPEQLLRAIDLLLDMGQPELARPYAARLAENTFEETEYAQLVENVGMATFLRLMLDQGVGAEGRQFARDALLATESYHRDPQRLSSLVDQAKSPIFEQRVAALRRLRDSGVPAIEALLQALQTAEADSERDALKAALLEMGEQAVPALTAVVRQSSTPMRVDAMEVLGRLGTLQTAIHLMAPALAPASPREIQRTALDACEAITGSAPRLAEAVWVLRREAEACFGRECNLDVDSDGMVLSWTWRPEQAALESFRYPQELAAAIHAYRFYNDLYALDLDPEFHVRSLIAGLEVTAYDAQQGREGVLASDELQTKASEAGLEFVESMLTLSLRHEFPGAARLSAKLVGEMGDATSLQSIHGESAPLVLATRAAHRRLRFEAVQSVLSLGSGEPYAGSATIANSLGFFASSTGVSRAVVAHPSMAEARNVASFLEELGYQAEATTGGTATFIAATKTPDCELVILSTELQHPRWDELWRQLRRDRRTALVPIGVMASRERLERARWALRADRRSVVWLAAPEVQSWRPAIERLIGKAAVDLVPAKERLEQAATALGWMRKVLVSDHSQYDLREQEPAIQAALLHPELMLPAAEALAMLGTPGSQRALADFASQQWRPLTDREMAVDAFSKSVSQFGVLLTHEKVVRQYERYNASESLDRETQLLLGKLLDALETGRQTDS